MPAPTTTEALEHWTPEQLRRQAQTHRGPRPARKPKDKK